MPIEYVHTTDNYLYIQFYIHMIYIDVQFILQKQCHTVISLVLGDTTNFGGFWFPLFEVEILVFCVEALCKLQSVLVPLTLAIGVLADFLFTCLKGEV